VAQARQVGPDLGHPLGHLGHGDHGGGARVPEQLAQFAGGVAGVDRHGDQAGAQRSEERVRELGHVRQADGDPRSRPAVGREVEAAQRGRDGVHPGVHLTPGDHALGRTWAGRDDEGGRFGRGRRGPPYRVGEVVDVRHGA
jgi:hypothetical protein